MKKKTKIIIAVVLSIFVLGLTGLGLWLFLRDNGGGGGGGTITDPPVQYTETNLNRFATALNQATGGDIETAGLEATMKVLAELKDDYMYNAGLGFQDAQIPSDKFFKVIEFLEGLKGDEGYVGFAGTVNAGKTIFEALDIDLTDYFSMDALNEAMGESELDGAVDYLMQSISQLVTDMKGSSLTQGASAGKLRQLIDMFKAKTGLTTEDIGKVSYYLFDRFFQTIQDNESDINRVLNAELRARITENDPTYAYIQITATSWVSSIVTPTRITLKEIGVGKFSSFVTGLLDSIGDTFDGLSRSNLNTLNQVLDSLTQNIIDAGSNATQVEAAYQGAINSLTGLASSKAADMRAKRTLLSNNTYTFFNVDSAIEDLLTSLENKFLPMFALLSGDRLDDYGALFMGNSVLDLTQTLVDATGNGMLNVLDLLSNNAFARQLIEIFVARAKNVDGRTFSLQTVIGINGAIEAINDRLENDFGFTGEDLVYVSDEGGVYTYEITALAEITPELKDKIYAGISKISVPGLFGYEDLFGLILQNVDEVVVPKSGDDREVAVILKLVAAFLGTSGDTVLITRNADNAANNVELTLQEKGLSEAIIENFYKVITQYMLMSGTYLDLNYIAQYSQNASFLHDATTNEFHLTFASDTYSSGYYLPGDGEYINYYRAGSDAVVYNVYCYDDGEPTRITLGKDDYLAVMGNFPYANTLTMSNAYLIKDDDVTIYKVYLVKEDSDIMYYNTTTETLEIGLTTEDLFAQLAYGVMNNVPENVVSAAFQKVYNRDHPSYYDEATSTYIDYVSADAFYNAYSDKGIGDFYTQGINDYNFTKVLNAIFTNNITVNSPVNSFYSILRYLQAYNNVVAPANEGYNRIMLHPVDQNNHSTVLNNINVECDLVNSVTNIAGATLAYDAIKAEADENFFIISLIIDALKHVNSDVPLAEKSGSTTTILGEEGASDFTLAEELEIALKNSLRKTFSEIVADWDTMGLSRDDYETDAGYNAAILAAQNDAIDASYEDTVGSMVEPVIIYGNLFSGTILYLFELPQEANNGNTRLTQLVGALAKMLVSMASPYLPF